MPIFFLKDIDAHTRLAIWRIEETEDFFLKKAVPQRMVAHPHKRVQHLAGRYLLHYLFSDFPIELIRVADTRKPFLEDEAYHFSISHCGHYAAAIVSKTSRVGVDIEEVRQTVGKVHHKFVASEELGILEILFNTANSNFGNTAIPDLHMLTLLWSCKEAVYKWFGWGEMDFKEHIVLKAIRQITDVSYESIISFEKNEPILLKLHSYSFDGLVLSYIVT